MHAAHLVHSSVSFKNMTSLALLSIAHLRKSRLNNKANILHLEDIQAETRATCSYAYSIYTNRLGRFPL